jgi:hypothetical protein
MNHGTFFNNPHSVAFEPANLTWKAKQTIKLEKNLTDKDKKKKVVTKKDNASHGLKYINPSQRNYSSTYE